MRRLVVVGTGSLGGAIVEALVLAGHEVAAVSRGAAAGALRPGVEPIPCDRHGDVSSLAGRTFDWAFDTCAVAPDAVDAPLGALGGDLGRYALISSLSVHGTYAAPGLTEAAPPPDASAADLAVAAARPAGDRASAPAYGASHGPLERACERAASARLGAGATALRAGVPLGAGDDTDRLAWWARRAGLAARPLAETSGPLVAWDRGRRGVAPRCGMTEAQGARLLGIAPG